jgi:uncharacterized membrane protein YccC
MRLFQFNGFQSILARLQWQRGLRAGLAVGAALLVGYLFGRPVGWIALGGLQTIMVDNGGPYRVRVANISTIMLGGALAVLIGVLAGISLPAAVVVTFLVCFSATLARVLAQPIAISSVTILVCYVVAVGGAEHTPAFALQSAVYFLAGALWAAVLSLVLWPADAFAPARTALADAFAALLDLVHNLRNADTPGGMRVFNESLATFRLQLEAAQNALAATPARMASRTVRARNLSVLAESADLLLARILRFAELDPSPERAKALADWLSNSIAPIEPALRERPVDNALAFSPQGSLWLDMHRSLAPLETSIASPHLLAALQDSRLSFETAYEALRAIWTGYDPRHADTLTPSRAGQASSFSLRTELRSALDTLSANLTLRSVTFRHALRLAAVVALDEIITRFVRVHGVPITHGYWLAMTSLIVLQPYTGETVRRSAERVVGTVAGAVLAAALAAAIHSELGLIAVISVGAVLSVAFYAVDYAWYCFFLTPTIVLLTLPHLQDWRFAEVRMGLTFLGALISVAAMLLLWPERESAQLPRLLARGAAAEARYLRAALQFWSRTTSRIESERLVLAPARRLCGLAANEAEETLDRALLEHSLPLNPQRTHTEQLNRASLTFTTYLRRLTQSITNIAAIGSSTADTDKLITGLADRLEAIAVALEHQSSFSPAPEVDLPSSPSLPSEQLARLFRQVSVLERTAAELTASTQV